MGQEQKIAIAIHGGAGTITKERLTPEQEKAYAIVMEEALAAGYKVLEDGGEATEAVVTAIKIMEDSEWYNAGRGSVLTSEGAAELDASIMEGEHLNAGAVAAVTTTKNPIDAARLVMTKSPHVMLIGRGADIFAKDQGLEIVENNYFITEKRKKQWERMHEREEIQLDHNSDTIRTAPAEEAPRLDDQKRKDERSDNAENTDWKMGTVGCVALDINGNLAAGTSTGGMTNKRYGRVGDSPIIGAGTYAENESCAVSCTGHGEFFIRGAIAYDVAAYMKYKEVPLQEAADYVIHKKLAEMGGDGGLIALDREGNIVMEFNTAGMFRGYINAKGKKEVLMYK